MDDSTIYTTSATELTTTTAATARFEEVLQWLHQNGLQADLAKMELITFLKKKSTCTGGKVMGTCYTDPFLGPQHITTTNTLHFLGVFINRELDWKPHIKIMANHTHSTIHRISILSNSVQGLDFLNWHKVYNALVIPMLMYGAQVWYTSHHQKGLVHTLQVAQNDSICKITWVFHTVPTEPLHNMTGIPPLSYMLPKLMHSYALRLQGLPLGVKVKTILEMDQCCYWPDYATPHTNLRQASTGLSPSTYHPLDPCTAGFWAHPQLHHTPQLPLSLDTEWLKESLTHTPYHLTIHIFICPTVVNSNPVTTFYLCYGHLHTNPTYITRGSQSRVNQMQALCLAVQTTVDSAITLKPTHIYL